MSEDGCSSRMVARQGSLRTRSIGPAIRRVEARDPTGLVSVLPFSFLAAAS